MTFSVTIPVWAINTFVVLSCIGCALSIWKTALEIKLRQIAKPKKD